MTAFFYLDLSLELQLLNEYFELNNPICSHRNSCTFCFLRDSYYCKGHKQIIIDMPISFFVQHFRDVLAGAGLALIILGMKAPIQI